MPEATVSAGEASRQVGEVERMASPIAEPNAISTSDSASATKAPHDDRAPLHKSRSALSDDDGDRGLGDLDPACRVTGREHQRSPRNDSMNMMTTINPTI